MPRHLARLEGRKRFVAEGQPAHLDAGGDLSAQPVRRLGIVIAGDPDELRGTGQQFQQAALFRTQPIACVAVME